MKPFMREDSAEFCSSCHKVHLDVPVNNYRWFRGFNDYDNWQASGVSGQGARSFYYPPKTSTCSIATCRWWLRRIPAIATARCIRTASRREHGGGLRQPGPGADEGATEQFLKSGFITVDIFAVSPVDEQQGRRRWSGARSEGAAADARPSQWAKRRSRRRR